VVNAVTARPQKSHQHDHRWVEGSNGPWQQHSNGGRSWLRGNHGRQKTASIGSCFPPLSCGMFANESIADWSSVQILSACQLRLERQANGSCNSRLMWNNEINYIKGQICASSFSSSEIIPVMNPLVFSAILILVCTFLSEEFEESRQLAMRSFLGS